MDDDTITTLPWDQVCNRGEPSTRRNPGNTQLSSGVRDGFPEEAMPGLILQVQEGVGQGGGGL